MATVPGPDPNKPLPRPDAPGIEPEREEDEKYEPSPRREEEDPGFDPVEPWSPEREEQEEDMPVPL